MIRLYWANAHRRVKIIRSPFVNLEKESDEQKSVTISYICTFVLDFVANRTFPIYSIYHKVFI